jgi:hypothetical protein
MAKIVFYEDNTAALVEDFMKKVHDPEVPGVPDKAAFLDSKDIETRTKISTEEKTSVIATTLTSIAALIQDLVILYPIGSNTPLPAMVSTRIKEENIEGVTVAIMAFKEENADAIDGMEYIDLDPETTEISEKTFLPDTKKILYLMKSTRAEELVKSATQNSVISIPNVRELAAKFDYDETVRVSVAIPQLSTGSWIDLFNTLEMIIEHDPIDAVYIECERERDFFICSIIDILNASTIRDDVEYEQDEKSFIEIIERPTEEEKEEVTPISQDDPKPIVDVEAEEVKE